MSSGRSTGCSTCRARTAAGRPSMWITIWTFLSLCPVRRSQRHARSDLSRHYGTRARSALCCTWIGIHPAIRRGVRISETNPGSGRKLVRPLGRGLRLRHVPGAARIAGGGRAAIAKLTFCGRGNGSAPSRTPTAAGARVAPAIATARSCARQHRIANRLGRTGAAGRRRHHQHQRRKMASITCCETQNARRNLGRGSASPAPVFLRFLP